MDYMKQKRVAAIHDISGFGKCSLTVALPIISAAGIEACAIPTAVLSTHTGGLDGFTYRDLTDDLFSIAEHWKKLNLHFDAIYSGFLGSYSQINIVFDIFDLLKSKDTLILVDPCMADNGELYKVYSNDMAAGMKKLCSKADIIVPNLTEASMLLGIDYTPDKYTKQKIEIMLKDLTRLGCKKAVITGVSFDDQNLGAACYDSEKEEFRYSFMPKVPVSYHGTGDVFASVLISCLMSDLTLPTCVKFAVEFTSKSIEITHQANTDGRFGVNFECVLPDLIKNLNKLKCNNI